MSTVQPTVDLHGMFLRLQTKMAADLECNRDVIDHPSLKGDACETRWLKLFDDYLPSRYVALRACAIDSHGNRSEQLDVVIIDRQYCPLLFNENGICHAPAESVYAVFEVKQTPRNLLPHVPCAFADVGNSSGIGLQCVFAGRFRVNGVRTLSDGNPSLFPLAVGRRLRAPVDRILL